MLSFEPLPICTEQVEAQLRAEAEQWLPEFGGIASGGPTPVDQLGRPTTTEELLAALRYYLTTGDPQKRAGQTLALRMVPGDERMQQLLSDPKGITITIKPL